MPTSLYKTLHAEFRRAYPPPTNHALSTDSLYMFCNRDFIAIVIY